MYVCEHNYDGGSSQLTEGGNAVLDEVTCQYLITEEGDRDKK